MHLAHPCSQVDDDDAICQVGAWPEANVMMQQAAALGVAPASYRPVGDALAAAVRQELGPLFAAAERWAVMSPHAREALVRQRLRMAEFSLRKAQNRCEAAANVVLLLGNPQSLCS